MGLGLTIFFSALKVYSAYTRQTPPPHNFGQILEIVLIQFKMISLVLLFKEQNAIASDMFLLFLLTIVCIFNKDMNCRVVIL